MFEEIIASLDELGVEYTEDYEAGVLDIAISAVDKDVLIQIIQHLNDLGLDFTIDEATITVQGGVFEEAEDDAAEDFNLEDYM